MSNFPILSLLNNKMDNLHITQCKLTIQNLQNHSDKVFCSTMVQYKWIQYCVFSFNSFLIHLYLALDHKMLLANVGLKYLYQQLEMCRSQGIYDNVFFYPQSHHLFAYEDYCISRCFQTSWERQM